MPTHEEVAAAFRADADAINQRHRAQTVEGVAALRHKYDAPVFGMISPWALIENLARCIDPTDAALYGASQQLHVLQMLALAETDGVATEAFVLAALVHDLGKLLLLTDEAPENIVCFNEPIGTYPAGIGLDNCVFQWNHDEFAYSRLKPHLPDGLAWLVRYHSIIPSRCEIYMDERDRRYAKEFLALFAHYDQNSKSPVFVPKRRIESYRPLIERALPAKILF